MRPIKKALERGNDTRCYRIVYPSGDIVDYTYDTGGQLKSVTGKSGSEETPYVKNITYDEYGQRVSMTLGNGDVTNYTYDPATRRLTNLKTVNGSTVWQDMTYEYDHEGNIKSINNKDFITKDENAKTSTQNFSYDELDRLTEANGTYSKESWLPYFNSRTNKYTDEFVYDEIGNITHKAQVNTGTYDNDETKNLKDTTYTWDYAYGSSRPHAVTKTGDLSYTYDASGNMTCKENSSTKEYLKFTWDDENRLTKTEDNLNRTTYRYDDTGTRIAKKGKFGETIYASDIFTVKNGTIESTHIFAGQTRIATKVKNTSTGTTSTTPVDMGVYYYHPDHLGSSSTVTNEKGKFTEHNEYFPYGEIWVNETNSDTTLPYKFTSKELDSETGLYYYGARYMDPKLGRFVSSDAYLSKYLPTGNSKKNSKLPGDGGIFNSVNLNLYQYAGNNPVIYNDPDGNAQIMQCGLTYYYCATTLDYYKQDALVGLTPVPYIPQKLFRISGDSQPIDDSSFSSKAKDWGSYILEGLKHFNHKIFIDSLQGIGKKAGFLGIVLNGYDVGQAWTAGITKYEQFKVEKSIEKLNLLNSFDPDFIEAMAPYVESYMISLIKNGNVSIDFDVNSNKVSMFGYDMASVEKMRNWINNCEKAWYKEHNKK